MQIYLDESGSFSGWGEGRPRPDIICALVVPDAKMRKFENKISKLKGRWGAGSREIKGSGLTDNQCIELSRALRKCDCFVIAKIVDSGLATKEAVEKHRNEQARRITLFMDHRHSHEIRKWANERRRYMRRMPLNLYSQMKGIYQTIDDTIRIAIVEFPFSMPRELAQFKWVVDGKDRNTTEFERLWSELVAGFSQDRSITRPLEFCEGADYTHFDRSYIENEPTPEFQAKTYGLTPENHWVNNGKIHSDLIFVDSSRVLGLQAVDMVASNLRKALRHKLSLGACKELGRLMIRRNPTTFSIQVFHQPGVSGPWPDYKDEYQSILEGQRSCSIHSCKQLTRRCSGRLRPR